MVSGLLIAVASLVAEHRLYVHWRSSCGSLAYLLLGEWDLSRLGIGPVSPALAGKVVTTRPLEKPEIL